MNRDWKPRGLRIERLEERLALSAATGVVLDLQSFPSSGPLSYTPNEGGLVDIAPTLSFAGNANGAVGPVGNGGFGNNVIGSSAVGFLLNSDILFDVVGDRDEPLNFLHPSYFRVDVGQNAGDRIPHISPPLPSEEPSKEGGNIELTKILYPLPTYSESDESSRSAELQRRADVGFPIIIEPTSRTPTLITQSAALSAIQGREIAFEVATLDPYDQERMTQHDRTDLSNSTQHDLPGQHALKGTLLGEERFDNTKNDSTKNTETKTETTKAEKSASRQPASQLPNAVDSESAMQSYRSILKTPNQRAESAPAAQSIPLVDPQAENLSTENSSADQPRQRVFADWRNENHTSADLNLMQRSIEQGREPEPWFVLSAIAVGQYAVRRKRTPRL